MRTTAFRFLEQTLMLLRHIYLNALLGFTYLPEITHTLSHKYSDNQGSISVVLLSFLQGNGVAWRMRTPLAKRI